jgi:hypothetical protein
MQEDFERILEQEYSQNHENSQLSSSDPDIELASREIMHHNEGVSNKITECTKKINRNLNLHNLRKLLMRMCLTVRKFVIKPMHNVNKIKMNNNCKLKFIEITNKREPILEKLIEIARSDTRFKEFNQKFNVTRPYFDEFFKYAKNIEFYNYFIDFLFSEDEENTFKTLTLGSISREKDSLEGSRFWAAYCHDSKSRNHYLKNNLMHSYFNKN